jgi:AraC-like DNA-binding protein
MIIMPSRCATVGTTSRNVLAAAADGVERFIDLHGGDSCRVLGKAGIPESRLGDPKRPLDLGSYIGMMELAAADTRNGNFGLWFGQQFQPQRLGLIGDIALSSPTLGTALANLAWLFPFHQQATETKIVRKDRSLRLEYRVLDGRILQRRQDAELTMGMFANIFRCCLGQSWAPEGVYFEHPKPEASREHQNAFDAPIYFGQRTNALVFRDLYLDCKMPGADLLRFTRLCDELVHISGGTGELSFLDMVKGEIRSALPGGNPHVDSIAELMHIPRWTFQRRLADSGHTFSEMIETVRRDLSALYVSQPCIAITDISFMLGYSEVSAFSRAFSRWFGIPPQSFRQEKMSVRNRGSTVSGSRAL